MVRSAATMEPQWCVPLQQWSYNGAFRPVKQGAKLLERTHYVAECFEKRKGVLANKSAILIKTDRLFCNLKNKLGVCLQNKRLGRSTFFYFSLTAPFPPMIERKYKLN